MIPLNVKFNRSKDEPAWDDLKGNEPRAASISLAVIDKLTAKGHPGVAIRFDLENGAGVVLGLTTARLLITAVRAIEAKYPGLMQEPS